MNNLINYQAFIEKKNILTINSLVLDIMNYHQINSQINVDLQVTGIVFTNNFDNKEQLNERLDFSFEVDKKSYPKPSPSINKFTKSNLVEFFSHFKK